MSPTDLLNSHGQRCVVDFANIVNLRQIDVRLSNLHILGLYSLEHMQNTVVRLSLINGM